MEEKKVKYDYSPMYNMEEFTERNEDKLLSVYAESEPSHVGQDGLHDRFIDQWTDRVREIMVDLYINRIEI